ncbi:site-specific integrase [Paenibacillus sp. V4I5]|uniref:tyrosine-type recombinase/integrase n=1 Tax=Paenibacillus sp. V4I5 TaxID=3042306 RepID=UPI002794A544|nr:site-specific integrase [Paenibacillus sp. V4I5]MDQ0917583.1 integrase [Paenibacillus sp. V4I5]
MATLEKRGPDSWRLTVELGFDTNGKRIRKRKTVSNMTKREAEKALAKFVTEIEIGEYIAPQKMSFGYFVEEWKIKYASKELAPKTLKNYSVHLKNHILPVLGHKQIDQIQPMHILSLLEDLGKTGARKDGRGQFLSSGTIQYIYRVIKNIFNQATQWKLLKTHPMAGIKKPKVVSSDIEYYSEAEAQEVIRALSQESIMWRVYCTAALIGGFRRGELVALEWSDVNFEDASIWINKSISLTENGQAILGEPKSKSSIGKVDMPKWFMDLLKLYQIEWEENKRAVNDLWIGAGHSYLFHGGFGKPLYFTYPSEWWRRFTERHNLKRISLHGLRHTTATILLEKQTDMKTIQERLRHANFTTTANIYTHVTRKISREAANKFDSLNPSIII